MNSIILHAINPTGMFSYGMCENNIHLMNKGLVHLQGVNEDKGGDSNGSGKSSLFYVICELLFQENPTGMKGDDVINSVWGQGMAGRLLFTDASGAHWRITYVRKWKKSFYEVDNDTSTNYVGTGLFLDMFDQATKQWKDSRDSTMEKTKEKIRQIVGLSYSNFLAISFLSPRVGSTFLRGTNKDRMVILSGITGVEEWDVIQDKCRKLKKSLTDQSSRLSMKVSHEQGSIDTLKEQLIGLKSHNYMGKLETANGELVVLRKQYADASEYHKKTEEDLRSLQEERDSTLNKDIISQLNSEESKIKTELSGVERSMVQAPVYADKALQSELNRIKQVISRSEGSLYAVQNEGNNLLSIDSCPVCDQSIPEEKKQKIVNDRQEKIDSINKQISALSEEMIKLQEKIDQDLEEKKKAEEVRVNQLYVKAQDLRSKLNDLSKKLTKEYEDYSAYGDRIKAAQAVVNEAQSSVQDVKHAGTTKKNEVALIEQKIKDIDSLEGQISDKLKQVDTYRDQMKALAVDINIYEWLISNIPSIKLLKLSEAMKEISDLANDFLANMGDSMRVNVSAFSEKSSKKNASSTMDMLKNEVNLEIHDGNKNIHPKLYSEGEIAKVSLAVAKAMHEMARKSGQGCNLMLMDEIFSFMDGNNSQRVAQSLQSMLTKGTVFLTDNSDKVSDFVSFDSIWVARKSGGCTNLQVNSNY